jgi:Domain of unknown function (DUF6285)
MLTVTGMHDRPDPRELLEAVREFLTHEVAPYCDDHRLKFRTLIAANVLSVAERQLEAEDTDRADALARLSQLDGAFCGEDGASGNRLDDVDLQLRALCRAIRGGLLDDDPAWQSAFDFALWHVEAKLKVSNPRYLRQRTNRADENADRPGESRHHEMSNTHGDSR